jgi:hypothetical protein
MASPLSFVNTFFTHKSALDSRGQGISTNLQSQGMTTKSFFLVDPYANQVKVCQLKGSHHDIITKSRYDKLKTNMQST